MNNPAPQIELTQPSPLLTPEGRLTQVGWSRQPMLDCNLENARFYSRRFWQRLRIKRWDYYGLTTPDHFFSATLADLGYAGQVFIYLIDFATGEYHEATLTVPFSRGITLPRNSTEGESTFDNGKVRLTFRHRTEARHISVAWPQFAGKDFAADIVVRLKPDHESMTIVIPMNSARRFYYNRKINCLPAEGYLTWGDDRITFVPDTSLGNLDWGRGVWDYRSFWVWASASGRLPDGRAVGLNLGFGFGDTSRATENALILNGRLHKLGRIDFRYSSQNFKQPWRMSSPEGRLDLEFTPFVERVAKTNLLLIASEVHQMFGRYRGTVIADDGQAIEIDGLIGWAEEHHARW
ncbi:MAG TPA: DUF2804 domain-containing protein [Anaerolineae bacterium]|nr:DUF2804 domain-containing protein [Anaerolineae bacterium]